MTRLEAFKAKIDTLSLSRQDEREEIRWIVERLEIATEALREIHNWPGSPSKTAGEAIAKLEE